MNRSFGKSQNMSEYLANRNFFPPAGSPTTRLSSLLSSSLKLACMGPEMWLFGKISTPIDTEHFSPVLGTNNVLHDVYPRVLILRMRWAGEVACMGQYTYLNSVDEET